MLSKTTTFKYHLLLVILTTTASWIECRQPLYVQEISQCSNEEYFNVNQLKCLKCEQTINHQPDGDLISVFYPKAFNQAFSSNLILGNQNFSFNSHLAATSSSSATQIQIQSSLERSEDGLSCVCREGNFPFKTPDSKLVKELVCLPCPSGMVSSLGRNTCSFCKEIPTMYLNNGDQFKTQQRPPPTKYSMQMLNGKRTNDCTAENECGDNEVLVERPLDSNELVNLNRSALFGDYNYTLQFNLTHLDQLLIRTCVKCPLKTRSINNQCRACHFSFEHYCACSPEDDLDSLNGVCVNKRQKNSFSKELYKINYTALSLSDSDEEITVISSNEQGSLFRFSPYVANTFHSSFSQCNYYHNITACQQFANLCVLDHYRYRPKSSQGGKMSTTDLSTVCDVYMEMNKQMPINYLPQIYFSKDENTKDFLFRTSSKIEYKLNERLRFYVIAFNANGLLKESRELYLDELLICSSKDQSMSSIVRFAVNVHFHCSMELDRLFKYTPTSAEDQLFYELYLLLNQTSSSPSNQTSQIKTLYPIYVLNRNLLRNDQLVNREGFTLDYFNYYMDHSNYFSDMINRWQLVKRFFMFEQLTSKEQQSSNLGATFLYNHQNDHLYRGSQSQSEATNQYGGILRYVSRMKLMIRSNPENPSQIYPPILILDYSQVIKQQLDKQQTVKIEFDVHFESSELGLYKKLTIFLAVFCSLIVLLALFRTWAWSKRSNHDNTLNLVILFKFVLFNCDYLANVFFVLVMLISINSFLIYKFQSVVYCFLPSKSLEHYTQLYVILAFTLKSISILHEFWIRSCVEIFFIDWEKSRLTNATRSSSMSSKLNSAGNLNGSSSGLVAQNGKATHEIAMNNLQESTDNHLYKYLNQSTLNGGNQSAVNGNSENLAQKLIQNQKLEDNQQFIKSSQLVNQFNQNAKYIDQYPDVSIWRTMFVANEYCELSTYRRVSISYHLFFLLIVLQCFGIENFAKADLELTFNLKESQLYVADNFTSRFVVGSLTFLLTVLANYAFTRYYMEPFICDKISEFVDFCSVSNVSIFCLMYEKFGYYVHGRNPTGQSEVNMPTMHHNLLTEEEDLCSKRGLLSNSDIQCFQMFLNDKLVTNYKKIRALLKQKTQYGLRVALHKAQNVQKIWYSYYLMNKLLSGFIDHMFVEMDYLVRERSVFEMLLDAEFNDVQMLDKSIFFPDKFHSFENVLFVGVELDVIFFELMFFTLVDLLTFNYIAAIASTFILNQILEKSFLTMAKKNLIRKSLVDERFLL